MKNCLKPINKISPMRTKIFSIKSESYNKLKMNKEIKLTNFRCTTTSSTLKNNNFKLHKKPKTTKMLKLSLNNSGLASKPKQTKEKIKNVPSAFKKSSAIKKNHLYCSAAHTSFILTVSRLWKDIILIIAIPALFAGLLIRKNIMNKLNINEKASIF